MIVGDSGSVIERLIKSGKFTYDEENMCLSKVTHTNKPKQKKEIMMMGILNLKLYQK
jgi:hypothetical protein